MRSKDTIILAAVTIVGLALGFAAVFALLPRPLVKVFGVADNVAEVYVDDQMIAKFGGPDVYSAAAAIRSGRKLRIIAKDSGGPRGVCILLTSGDNLVVGTTREHLWYWAEIDPQSNTRKGPAVAATNQDWAAPVSAVAGHQCLSIWGDLNASEVVLETTIP